MRRSVWMLVILTLVLTQTISAERTKIIRYRGTLADASGKPARDGNLSVTFRLYDVAAEGAPLWEETQPVAVTKGQFEANLGSVNALDLASDKPVGWVSRRATASKRPCGLRLGLLRTGVVGACLRIRI